MRVRNFSDGLNLRDAALQLAFSESPDNWNVTLDERGGVAARLGYAKYNATAFGAAGDKTKKLFYWGTLRLHFTQAGASIYKDTGAGAVKTFTTAARVDFADLAGTLYVIHPIDGLFSSTDGTTFTAVADPDAPKGDVLYTWQNKLFAAGNPSANAARVAWSAAGDGLTWATTDFNDLRDKDNEKVVALQGTTGFDINGRPGLLAGKRQSTYRIHDSATGAYQTIDTSVGPASALCMVNPVGVGRTVILSERGLFTTDGLSPLRPASERLEPFWDPTMVAMDKLDNWCVGSSDDRVRFSLTRFGSTVNDVAFEYHPELGWLVAGSNAMSCYSTYLKDTRKLFGGSPSVDGRVYELDTGGTDDGTAITSRFQTRWFEPNDGLLARIRRLRLEGRGAATMYVYRDFATVGDAQSMVIVETGINYDSGFSYDVAGQFYASAIAQGSQDFYDPTGPCKTVSIVIEATTTTTSLGRQVLQTQTLPPTGAWALYGFTLNYVPLGLG